MNDSAVTEDQSAVVGFLADPETHGGRPVQRIETHGAIVFLAGERAYKLKRAVAYPYMDFSTLERREQACRAEIALNRRTAPMLYLDVLPVRRAVDGRLSLGGAGDIVDWVVVMRRFEQSALLDRQAAAGILEAATIEDLAVAVAEFHRAAERRPGGGTETLRWVAEENLAEFREQPALFEPEQVETMGRRAGAWMQRLAARLDQRAAEGYVRLCHGDLHLRNVVMLEDRPVLFDAIEFNEAIAVIDVWYDVAFLLMDLDHRGLRSFGNRAFNRYLQATGDLGGLEAVPFFLSLRAGIRAKVAVSAAAFEADPEPKRREARDYFAMALEYLEPPPPRLAVVAGLSGTGKSTVARGVAPYLGAPPGAAILRSDVIRKELRGVPETERLPESAYRREVTQRVYATMLARAETILRAGRSVILDAVYGSAEQRGAVERLAASLGVGCHGVWLEAPLAVLKERVSGRTGDASDADARIVERQHGSDSGPVDWPRVDASGGAETTVAQVRRILANR